MATGIGAGQKWVLKGQGVVATGHGTFYTPVYTMGDGSAAPSGPPYRFGLQLRIGSSRVYLEMRAGTQEEADESLRDVALGLAARLEEWAKDRDRVLKPQMAAEGGDLYRVGGED